MEEWQDRQCDAHTSGLCARLQIMPLYPQQILALLPSFGSKWNTTKYEPMIYKLSVLTFNSTFSRF